MISPTTTPQYFGSSTTGSSTSGGTSSTAGSNSLDENSFMTLLVAQLKNQDPDSPLQPYELAAQLAQFTAVEQLTQLNSQMTTATQATQQSTLASQSALSASLIGRQVSATGDQVVVPTSGLTQVTVDIGGSGGTATLTLTDDSGNTIATRDLGEVSGGTNQTLTLPNDLPVGTWHYSISVTDSNQASVPVTTYVSGNVSSVEFSSSGIMIDIGGVSVPLSDLVSISAAATSTGTGGGSGTGTGGGTGNGAVLPAEQPSAGPIGIGRQVMGLFGLRPNLVSN